MEPSIQSSNIAIYSVSRKLAIVHRLETPKCTDLQTNIAYLRRRELIYHTPEQFILYVATFANTEPQKGNLTENGPSDCLQNCDKNVGPINDHLHHLKCYS